MHHRQNHQLKMDVRIKNIIIGLSLTLCVVSYALPIMVRTEANDMFYGIATTFSLGLIFLMILGNINTYLGSISISAGAYFICLSLIFSLNLICDVCIKTSIWVKCLSLITLICCLILLLRLMLSTR